MAVKYLSEGLKGSLQNAAEKVKAKAKEVEMPGIRLAGSKASERIGNAIKKTADHRLDTNKIAAEKPQGATRISARAAIKIIFFMMAADGEIYHGEEEKFDAVGSELYPNFAVNKEAIICECRESLDKAIDPEDYSDALQDGVDEALIPPKHKDEAFISPKLLVWNLLSVAYSDEKYDEAERKLLKHIVRKLGVDKSVFLEMENSMLAFMDIEKELAWIKTTDRPYLTIEAMVNELADRKNVIFESVLKLIAL